MQSDPAKIGPEDPRLSVRLGPLRLRNPILTASGTFGYVREMAGIVDLSRLGGVVPKTITLQPRIGNPPPRIVETPSGMLNSIGLDNDGLEHFLQVHLPYLRTVPTQVIVNIAGKTADEFAVMAERLAEANASEGGLAGLELNLSCPNVAGGVDFAVDPTLTAAVVRQVRKVWPGPLLAKLTPNVHSILPAAQAAVEAGADILSLVNTFLGMAVDWRRRVPVLGNVTGGLSGPAIKPMVLRLVYQAAGRFSVPIIAIGGITTIDDVMEFLVAGASAVQVGTANFFDPTVSMKLVAQLPQALDVLGACSVSEIINSIRRP
ncbi:MAG: dihydroorotate dehydrogenase [Gemmatales bacterium]|nr:dihydroorotate dehydrogenase [Gemmatales bacterium]MDW8387355.1 dihydroorotate dehydrogenase [Gemmatales bacterium]